MRLPVTPATEPHVWRQTFAVLSLVCFSFVIVCWLLIHVLDLIGPITDWNFVPPPVAGWTWDLAHVLTVVQTRR